MPGSVILSLKDISYSYGEQKALDSVNLDIRSNDFCAVIGPNGSGKTTLIKLMMKLFETNSGRVEHFPKEGDSLKIGYLPQQNSVDSDFPLSVEDLVSHGLLFEKSFFTFFNKSDKERIDKALDFCGVAGYRKRKISELSGGQLQRAYLARALVGNPELLILDEPDTYVDANVKQSFYSLLKELNSSDRDTAVVLVSHDVGAVLPVVKSIICVNKTIEYHGSSAGISEKDITGTYNCPIELIGHGDFPHRVLSKHKR